MKNLILFTFLLTSTFCHAIDSVQVAAHLPLNGNQLLKLQDNIYTLSNLNYTKFWQFRDKETLPLLYFELNESLQRSIYSNYFGTDSLYKATKAALLANNIKQSLCKVHNVHITADNYIYALVSGQHAQVQPGGDPDKDFRISFFLSIIRIANGKISECLPIEDAVIKNEYYLLDAGNFYTDGNYFTFTVARDEIRSTGNYYLGRWQKDANQRLRFKEFVPCEIPDVHKKSGANYGLLNFVHKENYVAILINDEVTDITTCNSIKLNVRNKPELKIGNLQYGKQFEIDFAVCDINIRGNNLEVIYRIKNEFYFYSLNRVDEKINSQYKLEHFNLENLNTQPFFYQNTIVALKKGNEYLYLLNLK